MDFIAITVFLFSSGISLFLIGKNLRDFFLFDLADIMIASSLLFWSFIILSSFTLSLFSCLNGWYLCALIVSISLVFFIVTARAGLFGNKYKANIIKLSLHDFIAFFIYIIVILNVTKSNSEFPRDWDSLAYHIPLVDSWVQSKNLNSVDSNRWSNPGNYELIAFWLVAFFPSDFNIVFTNFLPVTILFFSVYKLANLLLKCPNFSLLITALIIFSPVALRQANSQENDLSTLACFVSGYYFYRRYSSSKTRLFFLLFSLSIGILAGIKHTGPAYSAIITSVWLFFEYCQIRKPKEIIFNLILLLTIAFGVSGYWYCRNYIQTGFAFHPKGFIFKNDLLSEIYPNFSETSFFGCKSLDKLPMLLEAIKKHLGLSFLISFVFFPFPIFLSIFSLFKEKENREIVRVFIELIYISILAGIIFGFTPAAVEDEPGTLNQLKYGYCPIRYGICFFAMSLISSCTIYFFWAKILFGIFWKSNNKNFYFLIAFKFTITLCTFAFVFSTKSIEFYLIAVAIIIFLIFGILKESGLLNFKKLVGFSFAFTCFCLLFLLELRLKTNWEKGFINYYTNRPGFEYLEKVLSHHNGAKKTILMIKFCSYPYFGPTRDNRIIQPEFILSPCDFSKLLLDHQVSIIIVENFGGSYSGFRFRGISKDFLKQKYPNHLLQSDGGCVFFVD